MNYIESLREGDMISEIYFCKTKTNALTKGGKKYCSLVLQDKTGTVDGKIWDLAGTEHFEEMSYVFVEAQVTVFRDQHQLNIRRIRPAREGEYDVREYMPCSEREPAEMEKELDDMIRSVKEPNLNWLLQEIFVKDQSFRKRFSERSAARSIHHAFRGGLMEHTLSVTRTCDYMSGNYPLLNRDLLITAALCHDIGKVYELSSFPENDYTDVGNLMGHIVIGAMMVRDKIREKGDFPALLGNELVHCILAHHGELEFGSPKKPALMEAMALNIADNMDARMETFKETLRSSDGSKDWLGYVKAFEANVRRT